MDVWPIVSCFPPRSRIQDGLAWVSSLRRKSLRIPKAIKVSNSALAHLNIAFLGNQAKEFHAPVCQCARPPAPAEYDFLLNKISRPSENQDKTFLQVSLGLVTDDLRSAGRKTSKCTCAQDFRTINRSSQIKNIWSQSSHRQIKLTGSMAAIAHPALVPPTSPQEQPIGMENDSNFNHDQFSIAASTSSHISKPANIAFSPHHSPSSQPDPSKEFLHNRLAQFEDLGLRSAGLPIRFKGLSVYSSKSDHIIIDSLPWSAWKTIVFPFKTIYRFISTCHLSSYFNHPLKPSSQSSCKIKILNEFNGVVNQSEMLLVLGRPGGGMTTMLRTISLNHDSFSFVDGHIDFGLLSPENILKHGLRSQILMIEETDDHLSSLKVNQTLSLAARCKTPMPLPPGIHREDWANSEVKNWSNILGISPTTLNTIIGSGLSKGISGGERKRVSVIEGLLARPSVLCLDNVTAGLDSLNSYHLINAIKNWCKVDQTSAVVGLRQVSDSLYRLFDRVSVLYDGHQIYFGPIWLAPQYFIDLGFIHTQNQPIADFLCSVTDPSTRKIRTGFHQNIPVTPTEFVAAFERSPQFAALKAEMIDYDTRYSSSRVAQHILTTVPIEKDTFLYSKSHWTVNYIRQLLYLTLRQYALIRADLRPSLTKTTINLILSVVIGTLFYQLPTTTSSAFIRGSVLFLSVLFNGYLQLSELANTLIGRPIVKRHGNFGFYSPSSLALARTLGDLPLIAAQVLMFATITYALAGLQKDFTRFVTYILIVYATAINLTAMFRTFAALSPSFDETMRYCGITLNILVVYGGYFIPTPSMNASFSWIRYYLNPIAHAFEAVLSNEFHGLQLQCSSQHIVPRGPSYTNSTYQTCSLPGSKLNSLVVLGDDYLRQLYGFEYKNLWHNLFMIFSWNVVFLVLNVLCTKWLSFAQLGSIRLFRNSKSVRQRLKSSNRDPRMTGRRLEEGDFSSPHEANRQPTRITNWQTVAQEWSNSSQFDSAVMTFSDLKLWIKNQDESRVLLEGLTGYIQPGEFTALMGESGSGKTTLLNALAGRARYAQLSGEILIDGKIPTIDNYRSIGYVEQLDFHDEYSTVREALIFSASLRQPKSMPRWAKLADVDRVIALLGLQDLQHAIVGTPTAGLGLEDRKKLSIAVELVTRPRILCLDEPITGLDSQSATHIINILRRIVLQTNLAVIITVHQPSVEIFECFDRLILLEKGGRMAYFGTREGAVPYFESKLSGSCGSTDNPAEYLIDLISNPWKFERPSEHQRNPPVPNHEGLTQKRVQSIVIDGVIESDWRLSPDHMAVVDKVHELNSGAYRLDQTLIDNERGGTTKEEISHLTKRLSRNFWRDNSFSFTQIFTAAVISIIISFSFFQQAKSFTSLTGLKNQMFSVFLILFVPPVFMNQLIVKWFKVKSIYEAKEKDVGMYKEISLGISFVLAELPYCILSGVIYWIIWFFGLGFNTNLEAVGFTLVAIQMFFFFQATLAIWIAALIPKIGMVTNALPFFLISMEAFNGGLIPYDQIPKYWKWMYWVSPLQWYLKSILSITLHNQKVVCKSNELIEFHSPKSMSCKDYSKEFLKTHSGYLFEPFNKFPLKNQPCEYCLYSSGDEFLSKEFKFLEKKTR
ncbi:hypothetical protein O181_040484 [Austropuccinia psidii MF-1]|uniref:ABC transporter domain-containing protein n=1 Tax=Austropuccinia psidii MF-1 TaxID=1389203 RepID=A0A9Q3HFK3_9BASI|nr:hypothetical protein [Austropuccinia psidii MF-1]